MLSSNGLKYPYEFRVNDNGILYPGYMMEKHLRNLAYDLINVIIYYFVYVEVKVCRIHCEKGLSWEMEEYSEDADDKELVWLSRTHTFELYPEWKITGFHSHWLSLLTPRYEGVARIKGYVEIEQNLQKVVDRHLGYMEKEYQGPIFTRYWMSI